MLSRRQLLRAAVAAPFGAWMTRYKAMAAPYEGEVRSPP